MRGGPRRWRRRALATRAATSGINDLLKEPLQSHDIAASLALTEAPS
jgi:hypothetical protein